jgi:hypothetical protein
MREHRPFAREAVEIRRIDIGQAERADRVVRLVVGEQEQNVRALLGLRPSRAKEREDEDDEEEPSRRMKITRVRYYHTRTRPIFNQSFHIVTVETDQGITGIGEGGSRDTIEQCAGHAHRPGPNRIEHLWQLMYRGYFYPPGREKIHALGRLDLALWDIKGKALGVPVYELLGGLTRDHVECYSTGFPRQGSRWKPRAPASSSASAPSAPPYRPRRRRAVFARRARSSHRRTLPRDPRGRGQGRRLGHRLSHPPRFRRRRPPQPT